MSQNPDPTLKIRRQYEAYPYPPRDPADEAKRLLPTMTEPLPLINHYCFGGKRDFARGFRVLVAGGGTGDATTYLAWQLQKTDARIVHLDLSEASMEIARARARQRGLEDRIEWVNGSLLDASPATLGKFDYINCSGVLHHLADPPAGLRALESVLDDDGALGVMLYARYGRTAIYQVQELMRLVLHDIDDQQRMVEYAKSVLDSLPPTNWFKRAHETLPPPGDRDFDAGIFDLFLHSQDRAYSVPELYELVESAGLHLVDFAPDYRPLYDPRFAFSNPAILEQVLELPKQSQQAATELFWGSIPKHVFWISRGTGTFADPADLDNVPFFFGPANVAAEVLKGTLLSIPVGETRSFTLSRPDGPRISCSLSFDPLTRRFVELIDGRRTLGAIAEAMITDRSAGGLAAEVWKICLATLETLRLFDVVLLRHSGVPPIEPAYPRPEPAAEES
jgi:SAM-dependent methyltransferase